MGPSARRNNRGESLELRRRIRGCEELGEKTYRPTARRARRRRFRLIVRRFACAGGRSGHGGPTHVLLSVGIGGCGRGRLGSTAARGGGVIWREEEERGMTESSFAPTGEKDGGCAHTASPTREVGVSAERIEQPGFFLDMGVRYGI
jgi:hypothetical protein